MQNNLQTNLTNSQSFSKDYSWEQDGNEHDLKVFLRYDDECNNGHNTFAITGSLYTNGKIESCGCLHDTIAQYAPEFAPYIKWHLVSSDEPMHYIANTIYHAKNGDLEAARSTAIWSDATLEQLQDKDALEARLPALMQEFKAAMETLGFIY